MSFFVHLKMQVMKYKDLMPNVYLPVSKYHQTNIYIKENSNNDCDVNVKSVEISKKLGKSLAGLLIYPLLFGKK